MPVAVCEPAARVVLLALQDGPLAMRDIVAQTGLRLPTAKGAVRVLRAHGVITMGDRDRRRPTYTLA